MVKYHYWLYNSGVCKQIALGRDPYFKQLAEQTGAVHWKNWNREGITRRRLDRRFGRAFHQAVNRAQVIHFDLTGIDEIESAVKAGKKGFTPGNFTNAELHYIFSRSDLLQKTKFYRNGVIVV